MDHESIGTRVGVLKELDDMPLHCGLKRTCKVYVPAGSEIVTTVTPGFG